VSQHLGIHRNTESELDEGGRLPVTRAIRFRRPHDSRGTRANCTWHDTRGGASDLITLAIGAMIIDALALSDMAKSTGRR
jgi:hypothetical protein